VAGDAAANASAKICAGKRKERRWMIFMLEIVFGARDPLQVTNCCKIQQQAETIKT